MTGPPLDLLVQRQAGFTEAVVSGLDTDRDASNPDVSQLLRDLLWTHAVVCVRSPAPLTDDQHRALVSMIGPIKDPIGVDADNAPVRYSEQKQVIDSGFVLTDEMRAERGDQNLGGDDLRPGLFEFFHTDDSYVEHPASVTVLHARALPTSGGGATSFLDMRAAYELLDAGEREALIGRRAVHAYNNNEAFPPRRSARGDLERLVTVAHPIVRAHPVTGIPALYFDLDRACSIEGLDLAEGRALLRSLQDRAERDAPHHDHHWQPNDVLLWDNAAVQHKAGGDFALGQRRRFWRYMVEGTDPVAYLPPPN